MASGPRMEGESEMAYKRRLKFEEKEAKRQERVKAALPKGGVTVEERIGQVYSQMLDNAHLLEDDMPEGEGQLWLTLLSYTAHLEARVADLEGQMTNLLASLQMAAELEQGQKSEIIVPEIIIP